MTQVTVGIPAYKAEHLGQAIASVLSQTFQDFELLISDDCPDGSVKAVVDQFRDPRIRVIEGPRKGLIPNSVHIWENAACDLLKFVYDDDFLLPFGLAQLVELLNSDPQLTYAFCSRYVVDANGRILFASKSFESERPTVFMPAAVAEAVIGGVRNPIGEPTNILIRRSRFEDSSCLGGYAGIAIRHHIDLAFFLNACERGPCIGGSEFGAAFRRHGNQVTSLQRTPDFSYSVAEWEILIRAAVSRGLVAPAVALQNFGRLELHYANHRAAFAELDELADGLPMLRAGLERGERHFLDADFLAQLGRIEAAIAQRRTGE